MKRLICLILAMLLSLSLCACDAAENVLDTLTKAKPKTFTVDALTLELTDDFFRLDMLAKDFDFAIGSEDITILGTNMGDAGDMSAWDFAVALREGMGSETVTEVADLEGIPTMLYTVMDDDGEEMTFMYAIYIASDGLWLLQFGFESEDFEELYPLVKQYACSVTCN